MTSPESMAETSVRVVDPVCGMKILPEKAAGKQEYEGQTYYFCGRSCAEKFKADPASFLAPKQKRSPAGSAPLASGYTCPMHPEVHKDGPGDCPKCGMALEPETMSAPATRTQYTCPMHPQIVRDAPGDCPICGMALEPMTVTVNEANPELDSMTRRFWISAALTLPLLAIMVSDFLPGHPIQGLLRGSLLGWFELAIATPVVLWAAGPSFNEAGRPS